MVSVRWALNESQTSKLWVFANPPGCPRSRTYKQELALTNEMELFVFTWANQSFVCYVTFFISCSPRDLPARHATLKNSCKTKTTIDFLACYFDL